MAKRTPLSPALAAATKTKDGGESNTAIVTTGISIPTWALNLVADVAHKRKKNRIPGAASSVSAILLELIEKNKAELEYEIR